MKEYDILVRERLHKTVTVEAESLDGAVAEAEKLYSNGDIIIDETAYNGVNIYAADEPPFSENPDRQKVLDAWLDAQLSAYLPCPRCGKWAMKPAIENNHLSKRANLYICDKCGGEETSFNTSEKTNEDTLDKWAIFNFAHTASDDANCE